MPPKSNFALLGDSSSEGSQDDNSSVSESVSSKHTLQVPDNNVAWADMDTSDEEGSWEAKNAKQKKHAPASTVVKAPAHASATSSSPGHKVSEEALWVEHVEDEAFEVVKKKGKDGVPVVVEPVVVKTVKPAAPVPVKTGTGKLKTAFSSLVSDSESESESAEEEVQSKTKPTKAAPREEPEPTLTAPTPKKKNKKKGGEKEDISKVISEFQEIDGIKKKKKKKPAEEAPVAPVVTKAEPKAKAAAPAPAPAPKAEPKAQAKTKLAEKIDTLFEKEKINDVSLDKENMTQPAAKSSSKKKKKK